ncbi:indole-3-glycerol phosphate synthase TrpC [Desulfolucanica intricata]|uniref:indole-3-glycerol phosphate synthase TrpC n=1 Tax=Desulfolucanica intricata TaxID=1285191 RepID=UPI00082EAE11|nr:indole-3-glycerol phosphate synthase TrpC [Desulfolucanica intricata]
MRPLSGVLKKIVDYKKLEVNQKKKEISIEQLKSQITDKKTKKSLYQALKRPGEVSIIAELKRKSPSKGLLRPNFNPEEIITSYTRAGAAALSVLTDENFFGGSPEYLKLASGLTPLPLLRKDFIIDEYQIYEAKLLGADAVLLITRALTNQTLLSFYKLTRQLGMEALVEVHREEELAVVFRAGVKIIGINNRNLETFQTDIDHTLRLIEKINDPGVAVVSESGIKTCEDILTLKSAGVDAVLVGEAFMVRPDPGEGVRELRGFVGLADGRRVENA